MNQLGINDQFKTFYEKLYTSEQCKVGLVDNFFMRIMVPRLENADRDSIEGGVQLMAGRQSGK